MSFMDELNQYQQVIRPQAKGRMIGNYLSRGMSADDPSAGASVSSGLSQLDFGEQQRLDAIRQSARARWSDYGAQNRAAEAGRQSVISNALAASYKPSYGLGTSAGGMGMEIPDYEAGGPETPMPSLGTAGRYDYGTEPEGELNLGNMGGSTPPAPASGGGTSSGQPGNVMPVTRNNMPVIGGDILSLLRNPLPNMTKMQEFQQKLKMMMDMMGKGGGY